jgi:hypothetical protein
MYTDIFTINNRGPREPIHIWVAQPFGGCSLLETDGYPVTWVSQEDREAFGSQDWMVARPSPGNNKWRFASRLYSMTLVVSPTKARVLGFMGRISEVWGLYRLAIAARTGHWTGNTIRYPQLIGKNYPTPDALLALRVRAKLEGMTPRDGIRSIEKKVLRDKETTNQ